MLADDAPEISAEGFGGGLQELSLSGAVQYWGDVERLRIGEVDAPEKAHAGEIRQEPGCQDPPVLRRKRSLCLDILLPE